VKTQVPASAEAGDGVGLRRFLLGGVVLEGTILLGSYASFADQCHRASGVWGCRGGGLEQDSKRGATATLWSIVATCRGLGGNLGRAGGRVVGSSSCVLARIVGFYVEAATPVELVCLRLSWCDVRGL
jgi:hypothetical protein